MKILNKLIVPFAIGAVAAYAFAGCAALEERLLAPEKAVVPVVQAGPDGQPVTNLVAQSQLNEDTIALIKSSSRMIPSPWGELAATLAIAGLGVYIRRKNSQELKAHIEAAHAPVTGTGTRT